MKKTTWTLVSIFTLAGTVACVAQINPNLATNLPPAPIPVTSATSALAAFLHYLFPNVSLVTIGSVVGLLVGGANWLRNVIPDKWQVNKIGVWLSTLAGDVNPSMAKQISNAAEELMQKSTPPAVVPTTTPKV